MPKGLAPAKREPYEPNEIVRIIAACDQIGRGAYERSRGGDGSSLAVHGASYLRRCDVIVSETARSSSVRRRTASR